MDEEFFRQTRRFFAGILTDRKENQRGMAEKGPFRQRQYGCRAGLFVTL
jgi:hypothetical protein